MSSRGHTDHHTSLLRKETVGGEPILTHSGRPTSPGASDGTLGGSSQERPGPDSPACSSRAVASFTSFLIFLTRADATAVDNQPVCVNRKADLAPRLSRKKIELDKEAAVFWDPWSLWGWRQEQKASQQAANGCRDRTGAESRPHTLRTSPCL